MAHLKKLSSRLQPLAPRVLPIITDEDKLTEKSCQTPYLTKKQLDYLIPSLKLTASSHGVVSLSAPQVGAFVNIFVVFDNLVRNKWIEYDASPDKYTAYINTQLVGISKFMNIEWETCSSYTNLRCKVSRHDSVKVNYMNEKGDDIDETIDGFRSRVIQHEIDHMSGHIITSLSVSNGQIESLDPVENARIQEIVKKFCPGEFPDELNNTNSSEGSSSIDPSEIVEAESHKEYFERSFPNTELDEQFQEMISKFTRK